MTAGTTSLLEGTTVVSLEQAVAAPYATRQLADLGARVIKVERPGSGDFARGYDEAVNGLASYFVWLNRSKESVALDLKTEEGRGVLSRLLERADVFVQNLGPGAAGRLGLEPVTLVESRPELICCSVSGYGAEGPWARRKAYDLLVQAEAGLVSVTGTEGEAAKAGISVADIAAGMHAYSGILAALLRRERTGEGEVLEVSLFDALAEWMGSPYYYQRYGGRRPRRTGAAHATIAPYGPYATRDGAILLAVQNDQEWSSFCSTVLADEDLAGDPRFRSNPARVEHREALDAHISARVAPHTSQEVESLLDAAGIAYGALNEPRSLREHPALAERNRWTTVDSTVGPVDALLPPVSHGRLAPRMGPVPDLGEHTDAVLRELGYGVEEARRFHAEGFV